MPQRFFVKSNSFNIRHEAFVYPEIIDLLNKDCTEEVTNRPFCCNQLTVAESKTSRVVLDLRHINQYIRIKI